MNKEGDVSGIILCTNCGVPILGIAKDTDLGLFCSNQCANKALNNKNR